MIGKIYIPCEIHHLGQDHVKLGSQAM